MSFFPADFDPRDDVVALLDLCAIDTTDGTFRFMVGTDGLFVDSAGQEWCGRERGRAQPHDERVDEPRGRPAARMRDPTQPHSPREPFVITTAERSRSWGARELISRWS